MILPRHPSRSLRWNLSHTLRQKGLTAQDSRVEVGSVEVGIGIKEGAPRPRIGTPEEFREPLLSAKSITYADPARGGTSGTYFTTVVIGTEGGLLGRLGIADQLRSKTDRDSGDLTRLDDHHLRITFCYTPNCILTDGREHNYTSAPLRLLANSWTASLIFLLSPLFPHEPDESASHNHAVSRGGDFPCLGRDGDSETCDDGKVRLTFYPGLEGICGLSLTSE